MLTLPDRPNYDCEGNMQEDREVFIQNVYKFNATI